MKRLVADDLSRSFSIIFICIFFLIPDSYAQVVETDHLVKPPPDSILLNISDTLNTAIARKDEKLMARSYQDIGEFFYYHSDYLTAMENFLRADKIFRAKNDRSGLGQNLIKIGRTYYYDRKKDQALTTFNEALKIFQTANNKVGLAQSFSWIGQIFNKRLAYDSSVQYEQLALNLYTDLKDTLGIAKVYENIGSNYEDKGVYDSALNYFTLSLQLNHLKNNRADEANVINNIGDIYRKTGRYQEALVATGKAAALAIELNDRFQLRSAYFDLSKNYHLMGKEDSAYAYSLKDRELNFQIYDEAREKQMSLLQVLYSVDMKDDEIARLEKDRQINKLITVIVILSAGFFASLAIVIFKRQKTRLRYQQELNDKNEKLHAMEKSMIEAERRNHIIKETNLNEQLESKNRELAAGTLHLIRKNQFLDELKGKLTGILKDERRDQKKDIRQLMTLFNQEDHQDKNWEDFKKAFEQVHQHFFERLQTFSSTLTANDLRLLALLKINLSPADIASFLGISPDSLRVSRHRLRRKLGLSEGDSLTTFIQQL